MESVCYQYRASHETLGTDAHQLQLRTTRFSFAEKKSCKRNGQ